MLLANNKYRRKLSRIFICCLSSSFLVTSHLLPISALGRPQNSQNFLIAKSPDERQPEAVKKGIEQIPASQASISPRPKTSVESPIQQAPRVSSKPENSQPTSNSSSANSGTRRQSAANSGTRRQSTANSGTRRQPTANSGTRRQSTANSGTRRQSTANRPPVSQPVTPTYKEINFVDVALGILSKRDFQSQGRYFHFYEFEGRENQLVQIRLIGSNDTRRTNNLS